MGLAASFPKTVRAWLGVVSAVTVTGALLLPVYQSAVLPAAGGLGTGLLHLVLIGVGVVLGLPGLILALPRTGARILRLEQAILLVALLPAAGFVVYQYVHHTAHALLGPRATVVVPDGYHGRFDIRIRHPIPTFGWAAVGRRERFVAPPPGERLDVDEGWLTYGFGFGPSGESRPRAYGVHVVTEEGRGWHHDDFECTSVPPPSGPDGSTASTDRAWTLRCRFGEAD